MAGYHCLMPNGIVSLLTAPCMLPNGIFFLAGCHCLMPNGILFCKPLSICCLWHHFITIGHSQYPGSMQPHPGIGGNEKKPFHGGRGQTPAFGAIPLWKGFNLFMEHFSVVPPALCLA